MRIRILLETKSPWTACSLLPPSAMQPAASGTTQGFIRSLQSQCRRAGSRLHCPRLQRAIAVRGTPHGYPEPGATGYSWPIPLPRNPIFPAFCGNAMVSGDRRSPLQGGDEAHKLAAVFNVGVVALIPIDGGWIGCVEDGGDVGLDGDPSSVTGLVGVGEDFLELGLA